MLSASERKIIADLLFPEIDSDISIVKSQYPDRPVGQFVTRFGPSPTGFLHLGAIYASFLSWLMAKHADDGVFFLRIEDTDQQRKVEDGVSFIVNGLRDFGIIGDEGRLAPGQDTGDYGPYQQSERNHLYYVFLKFLIEQGHAYPCWMTTQELDEIRQTQRLAKQPPGVYGHFSQWRDASVEKIQTAHVSGDAFVIRMRTPYTYGDRKVYPDIIRGEVETLCPFLDSVLLKGDGFPTYHLAHLVDDYLMGTTHVIRAEEWLASVPLHVTLFELCGLTPPQYAHTAQLLKQDNGNKRKLSKRKDPEADVRGLVAQGFATQGILEYVMTIFSPDFELWQQDNVDKNYLDLPLTLEKMNASGALVDFDKMLQVNRNYLARLSNEELYDKTLAWATVHDEKLAGLLSGDKDIMLRALSLERHTPQDPKRFYKYTDVYDQVKFFDHDTWVALQTEVVLPENTLAVDAIAFLEGYKDIVSYDMETMDWFAQLKEYGQTHGYAVNNKQFKEGGYKGKVGDLAMLLRLVLCGSKQTPDLYSVMKGLGKDICDQRITDFISNLS